MYIKCILCLSIKVIYVNFYPDTFDTAQVWQCNAAEKSVREARLHQLCQAPAVVANLGEDWTRFGFCMQPLVSGS